MEVEVYCGEARRDEAVELLIASGSAGVVDNDTSITAYLPVNDGVEERYATLKEELQQMDFHSTTRPFKELDWTTEWKRFIKPTAISRGLLIKPTWEEIEPRSGQVVVEIDPGMAFGTGDHPSTRMCLKALESIISERQIGDILDVGTGAGVLAIAARRLGVERVVGIDTDVTALKVARKNARLNRVSITISGTPVERVCGRFALIVANIIAEELVRISEDLVKRMAPDGLLILSGIVKERLNEVLDRYKLLGLRRHRTLRQGEWVCLALRRGASNDARSSG
ncbi:MAG: 50S ribosomal protein L11 methyltransferase [Deltaproteobacteria bacterium]|nr:50S ribosomal protein L11 methyltransferase [Deltaproteobacteria bacterium]